MVVFNILKVILCHGSFSGDFQVESIKLLECSRGWVGVKTAGALGQSDLRCFRKREVTMLQGEVPECSVMLNLWKSSVKIHFTAKLGRNILF